MVTEELFFLRISQSVPGKWLQGGLNKVSSKIRNNMYIVDTIFFAQIFLIGQNKILFNILVVSKMKQWKRFRFILHSIFKNSTGWCDLVDCVPTREPKGPRLNSLSGHMPGMRARSPVGGTWEAATHWCFSPSFLPSFPLFKNKII